MLKFESLPSPERHIQRFETLGFLFGLDVAPADNARVLSIASGNGRNIIPQAARYPNSEFLAFDNDKEVIKEAKEYAAYLGLKNIVFKHASVQSIELDENSFDYIICHGLYSWVDKEIQKSILDLTQRVLKETGLAYISFNCLPGWYERGKLQKLLLEKTASIKGDEEKVSIARKELKDLKEKTSEKHIETEITHCLAQSDAFIFHELLNKDARAFHLRQFVAEANGRGLYYLADAYPKRMRAYRIEESTQLLDEGERQNIVGLSRVKQEQHMDHMLPLSFRALLLSKQNVEHATCDVQRIKQCFLSSPLLPEKEKVDVFATQSILFYGPQDSSAEIREPFLKAFFLSFRHIWPDALPFEELCSLATKLSGGEFKEEELLEEIKKFYFFGLLDIQKQKIIEEGAEREVPKHIRYEALHSRWVTTKKHEFVPIDDMDAAILPLLDGKTTEAELAAFLFKEVKEFAIESHSEEEAKELLEASLEEKFEFYKEHALL